MTKIFKVTLIILAVLLLIPLAWYLQSRLFNPLTRLKTIELSEVPPGDPVKRELTIGIFNIAHGRGGEYGAGNWSKRSRSEIEEHLTAIGSQIREASVDIMILNEVDFNCSWSKNIDQARLIAEEAGFRYVAEQCNYNLSLPFLSYRFGNAVLSRYPIGELEFIDFPPLSKREDLFAGNHDGLLCTVETPLGEIQVIPVHLEYRDEATRLASLEKLKSLYNEKGKPLIFAGDFNTIYRPGVENTIGRLLNSPDFYTLHSKDMKNDYTFPAAAPKRALDFIFTSRQLRQSEKRVYPSLLSDHLMVTTKMSLE